MSYNELLLAISNMMDKKLEPITNDIREIKEDVKNLKEDVKILKIDVKNLKEDVKNLKEDVENLKEDVENLKENVKNLEESVKNLEIRVQKIELCQETEILPQLNTITSCYKDTYDRYRKYADRMENAFDDITLLKKVVSEHSIQLQSIS